MATVWFQLGGSHLPMSTEGILHRSEVPFVFGGHHLDFVAQQMKRKLNRRVPKPQPQEIEQTALPSALPQQSWAYCHVSMSASTGGPALQELARRRATALLVVRLPAAEALSAVRLAREAYAASENPENLIVWYHKTGVPAMPSNWFDPTVEDQIAELADYLTIATVPEEEAKDLQIAFRTKWSSKLEDALPDPLKALAAFEGRATPQTCPTVTSLSDAPRLELVRGGQSAEADSLALKEEADAEVAAAKG